MLELTRAIVRAIEEKKAAALATVLDADGDLTVSLGSKMLFLTTGEKLGRLGSDSLERVLEEKVQQAVREQSPRAVSLAVSDADTAAKGLAKGRTVEVFIEVFPPRASLLIVGAGHIAVPLAKMGKLLDFEVAVLDDRASFANKERFPDVDQVIAAGFEATLRSLTITRSTHIVLITRGHQHDVESLLEVLDSPAAYIGMIGSRRRVWAVVKLLHEQGIPVEKLGRIHAPIGIDIGAQSPAEIAASIISEVIKVHRGGGVESISDKMRPKYISLLEQGQDLDTADPPPKSARAGWSDDKI